MKWSIECKKKSRAAHINELQTISPKYILGLNNLNIEAISSVVITPDGKYIRNSVFETATTRALKLALLLVNKTAGICVKEYKVYAISKEIYPQVKVISGGDSSLTYLANKSDELILLTVKDL